MQDCAWLVEALVRRLREIVPPGFVLSATGTGVRISREDQRDAWLIQEISPILHQPGAFTRNLETAADGVLSGIQDFIATELTLPWPGKTEMPVSEAAVRDGWLHLWFGAEEDPALRLRPIRIPT